MVTPAQIAARLDAVKVNEARAAQPKRGMEAHIKARCPQRANCTGPGCRVTRPKRVSIEREL